MNAKAKVSKELHAKHMKILEGLLKLPENRECAECKARAPRWASINLGIFICLQCSGIHRSLGVHISKVRSATLDTWLPDQVAFIQSMGNEKSNAYWEADLPPHYDRTKIERFIQAKYVEKRWIPREGNGIKSSPSFKVEQPVPLSLSPVPGDISAEKAINQRLYKEKKISPDVGKVEAGLSGKMNTDEDLLSKREQHQPAKNKENYQPTPGLGAAEPQSANSEPTKEPTKVKREPTAVDAVPTVPIPKADYATELFRTLYMDDSINDSSSSPEANEWVHFETDEAASTQVRKVSSKSSGCKVHPEPKVQDIQIASVETGHPTKIQKDARNDNRSLSERHATLPQDSSFPSKTTAIDYGGFQKTNYLTVNSFQQPPPINGRINHTKEVHMQTKNNQPSKFNENGSHYTVSSITRQINRTPATPAKRTPAALPVSGFDYDFSFLTEGMIRKQ